MAACSGFAFDEIMLQSDLYRQEYHPAGFVHFIVPSASLSVQGSKYQIDRVGTQSKEAYRIIIFYEKVGIYSLALMAAILHFWTAADNSLIALHRHACALYSLLCASADVTGGNNPAVIFCA